MNIKTGCAAALAFLCLFSAAVEARAQAQEDAPKVELGVQFSSLTLREYSNPTEPGFGGRVTYNLSDNVALEAQFDFFPNDRRFRGFRNGGRIAQGLFGVKAGKRFDKFGIFGKVRPGFASFSAGREETVVLPGTPDPIFGPALDSIPHRETRFATDVGAVLEFYPSRRIVTRFDAGDTIIRYGNTTGAIIDRTGIVGQYPVSGEVRHNFQFSAGVGFRF